MRRGYQPRHRAISILVSLVIGWFVLLAMPTQAHAQGTCSASGTFSAIGDSVTANISSCSTFFTNTLQDHSTPRWGGLVRNQGDAVRGPSNCGVGSTNTAGGCMPSPTTVTTSNASYSFSADLINTGTFTITLLSVTNAGAASDSVTMYSFVGAQDVNISLSQSNTPFSFSFTLPASASPPTLTTIAPNNGPAAGGTNVSLTGTNLSGATSVTFGGVAGAITADAATSMSVTAPPHAAGTVDVVVTTPGGSATFSSGYTYIAAPTVASVAPATGPPAGGTIVTIVGTDLAGASSVTFGGVAGTITANTATAVTVMTPAHAAGAVAVVVTTLGGTANGSFTYASNVIAASPAAGALPDGLVGTPYSQAFSFTGGTAPYAVTLSGTLPTGITFDPSTNRISGTPTTPSATPSTFTLQVTDAASTQAQFTYTLAISSQAPVANAVTANVVAGAATPIVLNVTGGPATRVNIVTQARHGIATASGTSITYTPTAGFSGTDQFTYTATNSVGTSAPATVTVNVASAALSFSPQPGTLPPATVGTPYSQKITVAGGTAPYGYAISGTLPPGLAFSNGVIAGTPTAAANAAFTIVATDASGVTGQAAYSLSTTAPVPVAISRSVQVMAGTTATVDLAAGASGGPFTSAAIVDPPAPSEGHAQLTGSNGLFQMSFKAAPLATGSVIVHYTISNAWHTSTPAAITFTILARPDPSKDAEVIGLVTAEVQSAERFATTQISNFGSRLEHLHDERTRQADSFGIQLGATGSSQANRRTPSDSTDAAGPGVLIAQAFGALPKLAGNRASNLTTSNSTGNPTSNPASYPTSYPTSSLGTNPASNAGETPGIPTLPGRLAFWTGGYVNLGTSDNDSIRFSHTLVGVSGGVDYRYTQNFVAGVGMGYGHEVNDVGDNGTQTKGQAISAAVYASYHPEPVFVDGLLGLTHLDFDSTRYVTTTGGEADGDRTGTQIFGSLSSGYEYRSASLLVSPYGRFQAAWTRLNGFTESGADAYDLTYERQEFSMLGGVAGLRAEYIVPTAWGAVAFNGRVEYTHDFSGTSRARLGYADTGTSPYGIDVAGLSQNSLSAQLGVEAQIRRNLAIGFSYQNTYGFEQNAQDHAFLIKIRSRF